ncbi:MAG: DUF2087 domain-containing protein [Syntrophomonas sp.]|uniref:DUF2087 domain-containing protein n=1 Tax=Syntrophomonas sp. TaxID=2053627 RepID=UPI0026263467|nr:DUF2087 domain-containing protein [Syntrophomonas sp.]MDD2509933.1 DUF2087 domain-containing protein [Syntrophomonas sp.]MDD3879730.1 DUF2087 domain-containing protein [Syntrophomonas sp.]MDD4626061.1 DUF2087 domain-containing protein [Syntrophomonas sp.]
MENKKIISQEHFKKCLLNIFLRSGLSEFPSDYTNLHVLLKSAILTLDKTAIFSEKEINHNLDYWINNISKLTPMKDIDHVTLRRMLVDSGYLTRNRDGSCYRVSLSGTGQPVFDDAIEQVDVIAVIKSGREEITRRKREYMEKLNSQ